MKLVKSEKIENNTHNLEFSIGAEAFNAAIAKAFKRESGKYNIPGFRKGKAPRHMIEKMYGTTVLLEAINSAASRGLFDYIEQNRKHSGDTSRSCGKVIG